MASVERLKELFEYDPETGRFTRKHLVTNSKRSAESITSEGYLTIHFDGKNHKAHRMAWLYIHGEMPEKRIDHKNGIKSDNRIENLRTVSNGENLQNLAKAYKNNKSSGLLGVYWHSQMKKWQARIQVNGKAQSLGLFSSKEEASEAYKSAKRLLHPFGYRFAV